MKDIKVRYTYKRREDGKIYQEIVPIECLEGRGDRPLALDINNPYWDIIARDMFTGKADKNGCDIYEGDILRYFEKPRYKKSGAVEMCGEVIFKDCLFQLQPSPIRWRETFFALLGNTLDVIGNIYENKELLK